ncbi:MAG: hypothetical protein P1U46_02680 [Patescibacteria group bacterium]|nr:hypothetical protein [Patescibacteria group bacterium]
MIDDNIINIPYDKVYYIDYNIYFNNTKSYYYKNNIFALKVARNKSSEN